MSPEHWPSGAPIIVRQLWAAHVWAAIPATVVEDSANRISLYVRPGTAFVAPDCSREAYLRVAASGSWVLRRYTWIGHHLWTAVPGEAYSIWTTWSDPDWEHLGWKVNPEAPLRRTAIGFDTTDHVLDAFIDTDFRSWTWKDEDEFSEAIRLGLISPSEAERIRGAALAVTKSLFTRRRAHLRGLAAWRPPEEWAMEPPGLAGDSTTT